MTKILLYIHDEDIFNLMEKVAKESNYEVLRIDDSYLNMRLGELFLEKNNSYNNHSYINDYLFMSGLTTEDLIDYLNKLRELGLEFEGIKVMETDTNKEWLLEEVMKETEKEHQVMQKINILQALMRSCNEMDLSVASDKLKKNLMNAYLLLQSGEIGLEAVNEAINGIMEALKEEKRQVS